MLDQPVMNENESLQISTYEQAGVPFVVAVGDVDLCTTPTLREALKASCEARSVPGVVAIDMREVPFIDSAGLALLVEMRKMFFQKCQIALIIARGSQPERVLKLGRFDTFLKVSYSPEDVISSAPEGGASPAPAA